MGETNERELRDWKEKKRKSNKKEKEMKLFREKNSGRMYGYGRANWISGWCSVGSKKKKKDK